MNAPLRWPSSPRAELAVLGVAVLRPRATDRLRQRFTGGDFTVPSHRMLFDALTASGRCLDLAQIDDVLELEGRARALWPGLFNVFDLLALQDAAAARAMEEWWNLAEHARAVLAASRARERILAWAEHDPHDPLTSSPRGSSLGHDVLAKAL